MKLTQQHIDYIKAHRLTETGKSMAARFGVCKSVVNKYMRENGLQVPQDVRNKFKTQANIGRTSSTPEIDKVLREEYLITPVKTLAKKVGRSHCFVNIRLRQLGLIIPRQIIEQRKKEYRIKPGTVPPNKGRKQTEYMSAEAIERTKATRFRKGSRPQTWKEGNGHISIRTDKRTGIRYQYIKLSDANWVELHRHNYEKEYGPVPKGMNVIFKDGNQMNCAIDNLELISNEDLMRRNSIHRYPSEINTSIRLLSKLNKKIKKNEK